MSSSDVCSDEEVRDFLLNDCNLSVNDVERYLSLEQDIRNIGNSNMFLTSDEIEQVIRVMKSIASGQSLSSQSSNPIDDYERAMGIL